MDELTLTFAEARFAKEALSPQLIAQMQALAGTPELSDNKRKLRDLIEQSIRGEQSRVTEAKELISQGKKRLTDPDRMGGTGTLALDAIRSLIPGLSISAADGDGIEKTAGAPEETLVQQLRRLLGLKKSPAERKQRDDKLMADWKTQMREQHGMDMTSAPVEKEAKDPDERASGRTFDIAHALAAAGGAGAGYAAQKGLFGGAYGRDIAERLVGGRGPLEKSILDRILGEAAGKEPDAIRQAFEAAARKHDVGLAAQRHSPLINKITRLFSGGAWGKRMGGGGATPTAQQARWRFMRAVQKNLQRAKIDPRSPQVRAALRRLPDALTGAMSTARASADRLAFLPGGWKGGLLGAVLATAPFAIYRLLKTRSLRRRGGTAAESAAEKAEKLLSQADELRGSRQKLLAG